MLDEPTSSLTNDETESLFRLIELAAKGVAIIYISHRLQELKRIADKISALRDGELVGTIPIGKRIPPPSPLMFGESCPATGRKIWRQGEARCSKCAI